MASPADTVATGAAETQHDVVDGASAENHDSDTKPNVAAEPQAARPSNEANPSEIHDESDCEKRPFQEGTPRQVRSKKKKTDRIKELETMVKAMEEKHALLLTRFNNFRLEMIIGGASGEADPDAVEEPNSRLVVCQLNPQFWKKFSEAPYHPHVYPIDVLVGEPELPKAKKKWPKYAYGYLLDDGDDEQEVSGLRASTMEGSDGDAEQELKKIKGKTMPERIRLSLFAVQYLLRRLLDAKSGIPHGYCSTGVIMLRPYKPLFLEQSNIQAQLSRFLKLLDSLEQSYDSVNTDDEAAASDREPTGKETKKPTALQMHDLTSILTKLELSCCDECDERLLDNFATVQTAKLIIQCLVNFITEYLDPIHQMHRNRLESRIAFCDLWHLFKPGDDVVLKTKDTPDDELSWHTSLLRVLRVQGGRPHIFPNEQAPFLSGAHGPPPQPPGIEKPPPPPGTPIKEPIPPRPKAVNGIIPFTVDAYYLDFNGRRITPIRRRFFMEPYSGERDIKELEVFPYEFVPSNDKDLQKTSLITRGSKFVDYVFSKAASHVECQGVELVTSDELNEQLLVDMKEVWRWNSVARPMYFVPEELDVAETSDCRFPQQCRDGPNCRHRKTRIFSDQYVDKDHMDEHVEKHAYFQISSVLKIRQRPDLSDDDLAICTYRLHAWGLQSRKWVQVHVNQLHRVRRIREDMGFHLLVLPEEHKQIIQAQVQEHFRRKMSLASIPEQSIDIVRGKGQGLIILLHGAPGVGKTATAECIADLVQRPLYPITCGDLGSTALEVEKELSRHFDLASRWDCVMLLDEADVFLAKRSREDHGRNAIVSVFLRMLEYYKGILFLTTNRIGTFDEAFKSRIHISLFYPNFDEETTISVWKTFIKQTQKANATRPNFRIDTKGIKAFAREHYSRNSENSRWNGRQIRNAFHTAIAMAEYEARAKQPDINVRDQLDYGKDFGDVKVELGRQQFDVIGSTVRQFDDYIKETIGQSYEATMEHEKMRSSKYNNGYKNKDKKSKKSKKKSKHDTSDDSSDSSSEEKTKRKKSSKKAKEVSSSSSDSD